MPESYFGYAVQLRRKNCGQEGASPIAEGEARESTAFSSFGYYDTLTFCPIKGLYDPTGRRREPSNTPKQEIVFVDIHNGAAKEDGGFYEQLKNSGFCSVSFLLFDELNQNTDSASNFKQHMKDLKSIGAELPEAGKLRLYFFATLGASGVAMVILPREEHGSENFFMDTLTFLQDFRKRIGEAGVSKPVYKLIYSFTVLCVSHGNLRAKNTQSLYSKALIDHIQLYILSKPGSPVSGYAGRFCQKLGVTEHEWQESLALLAGTDDYVLKLKKIPLGKILGLYDTAGNLYREECCKSVYLSLGRDTPVNLAGAKGGSVQDSIKDDEAIAAVTRCADALDQHGHPEIAKALDGLVQNYRSLRLSHFTMWFCDTYGDIIRQFAEIIKDTVIKYRLYPKNMERYLNEFISMFERFSFTNVFSTDAPGFHKLQEDFSPRLILAYNKRINSLLSSWHQLNASLDPATLDELRGQKVIAAAKKEPCVCSGKHVSFFSIDLLSNELKMDIFCNDSPPDKRLLNIRMSMLRACQPCIAIPGILHELGHAIGPRLRYQRVEYYVKTVTNLVCRSLFMGERAFRLHIVPPPYSPAYEAFGPFIGQIIYANQQTFEKIIENRFQERLSQQYEIQLERGKSLDPAEQHMRLSQIEQCYGSVIRNAAVSSLQDLVNGYPSITDAMVDQYRAYVQDSRHNLGKNQAPDDTRTILNKRWHFLSKASRVALPSIAGLAYKLLSEPLADLFMVQYSDMTAQQYLQVFFLICRESSADVLRILMQQTELTRVYIVLGVYFKVGADFFSEESILAGKKEALYRIREEYWSEYVAYCHILGAMYSYFLRREEHGFGVWNMCMSLDPLCDYFSLLLKDSRWLKSAAEDAKLNAPDAGKQESTKALRVARDDMRDLFKKAWKMGKEPNNHRYHLDFMEKLIFPKE